MALYFTFDDEGRLEWRYDGGKPELTAEQASIVATAEIAAALRSIAHAVYDFNEAFGGKEFFAPPAAAPITPPKRGARTKSKIRTRRGRA